MKRQPQEWKTLGTSHCWTILFFLFFAAGPDGRQRGLLPTSGTMGKIRRLPNAFTVFGSKWCEKLVWQYSAEKKRSVYHKQQLSLLLQMIRRHNSAVCTVTGYGIGGRGPIPARGDRFFSAPKRPDWLWGPPIPPIQWVLAAISVVSECWSQLEE
jgi:hypothetical protein